MTKPSSDFSLLSAKFTGNFTPGIANYLVISDSYGPLPEEIREFFFVNKDFVGFIVQFTKFANPVQNPATGRGG